MTTQQDFDIHALQQRLAEETVDHDSLQWVQQQLDQRVLEVLDSPGLVHAVDVMKQILEVCQAADCNDEELRALRCEMLAFLAERVCLLDGVAPEAAEESAGNFLRDATSRWAEYLTCLENEPQHPESDWLAEAESTAPAEDVPPPAEHEPTDSAGQIDLLLSAIGNCTAEAEAARDTDTPPEDDAAVVWEHAEIREAFLDDATRCLDSMEKASLAVEQNPANREPVNQFCRELHTLKGAAASVGLTELAGFVHEVETALLDTSAPADGQTVDTMLSAVDRVRGSVAEIQLAAARHTSGDTPVAGETSPGIAARQAMLSSHTASDDSIRIRASKLDRLMDMLAELVVLRNRRENHQSEVNELNEELTRCVARLHHCEEGLEFRGTSNTFPTGPRHFAGDSNTLREIGKDLSVVSGGIRTMQEPIGEDNVAISRLIRDFRQELMQLRRIPISGLFNRLQRTARDVAKQEGKQLQLSCLGGESGLEQELQEKLYEPLLHIVRNAVSHGIQSPDERSQSGKPPAGQLVLRAQSNSQLLAIEVTDDGQGLNYIAIRTRAMEKGLITAEQMLPDQQLAELIFHPGFSTRDSATEVSGRGVGMDVVARAINQLRGRIEIDSLPGQGTTMRLIVPLRSAIEHVMVFRSAEQLFALPMQAVTAASSGDHRDQNVTYLPFTAVLARPTNTTRIHETAEPAPGLHEGPPTPASSRSEDKVPLPSVAGVHAGNDDPHRLRHQEVLILRTDSQLARQEKFGAAADQAPLRVGLEVEQIVGPEEVVVRNLPGPLSRHPLFSGLTLAGSGESVLLVDNEKLLDYFQQHQASCHDRPASSAAVLARAARRALVVDDSLSARKVLVKELSQLGFQCSEAGDGIEALETLRRERFDLVTTDLEMPRLGGMELLLDIKQQDKYDVPVVVVSSRKEEEFRQQAIDGGAIAYLPKPIDSAQLQQLVEELN